MSETVDELTVYGALSRAMSECLKYEDRGVRNGDRMRGRRTFAEIHDAIKAIRDNTGQNPPQGGKCMNDACAKTDANGEFHDCCYPDCIQPPLVGDEQIGRCVDVFTEFIDCNPVKISELQQAFRAALAQPQGESNGSPS